MSIEMLTEYGNLLVENGFEVWLTRTGYRQGGYLQYRDPKTGNCGSLQYSHSLPGWQHLMPLVPSPKFGSSMFVQHKPDQRYRKAWTEHPLTVEAARQCASDHNWNEVVGTQPNARDKTWRSHNAVALHEV